MIPLLAFRNIIYRPWRSVLLFFGYGIGVSVMIVLLSVGEALLTQAKDEKLVGGGAITVLPQGLDVEVMKTGGIGGLFFSIDHARFVYDQLLSSPRLASFVTAVAPQIDGRLIYLRTERGREYAVRASGEIPGRTRAVRGPVLIGAGKWVDDQGDRMWVAPSPSELRHAIDHFHVLPDSAANRGSWAEWHYFNVLSPDSKHWAFISFIVAGDVASDRWGGSVAVTLRDEGGASRKFASYVPAETVQFSTSRADLTIGRSSVTVRSDGNYLIHAEARQLGRGTPMTVDLVVAPAPRAYFPGASLSSGDFVSGYTVPALRASATGSICVDGKCDSYAGAQSYHDHNWGVWRGVTWDWGAARAGSYTILYGRVIAPGQRQHRNPLFVYVVDSLGFRAVMRPADIAYEDSRVIHVDGKEVRVPARASFADVRGPDTLRVDLRIEDAIGTDNRRPSSDGNPFGGSKVERGDPESSDDAVRPYFIQMKGEARISGRLGGDRISGTGTGFFETYR
jgi:hypothetical protein